MLKPFLLKNQLLYVSLACPYALVANPDASQNEFEVIEVTARHTAQSLYQIPLSVTALSSNDIQNAALHDVSSLQYLVPGFSGGDFNLGQPQYYIRGIGSNADAAAPILR